ncbi:MAG: hypothetical protein KKD28_04620, partial [Chloroflexi bacterium]|nr:hypothetical protein [Chloroflexota bacterium]
SVSPRRVLSVSKGLGAGGQPSATPLQSAASLSSADSPPDLPGFRKPGRSYADSLLSLAETGVIKIENRSV